MNNSFSSLNKEYDAKSDFYYRESRPEVLDLLPDGLGKFLDVGCGDGSFGAAIKKRFADAVVWGIEPHSASAANAGKLLDKVIPTVFDEQVVGLENQKFECITFNDVLEHLINPGQILNFAKQFLADGGYVVASIPNILYFPVFFNEIILRQDWKYKNSGTLDNTHLRFFTKKSIIRLFDDAGYEIISVKGLNQGLTKIYRALNLLLFNAIYDWRFLQFGVLAKKK